MRSPTITQGQLEKQAAGWFSGCNSNRNPWILDDSQYAQGVNVVNRGGVVQARPGYLMALTLPPGNLQGFAIMNVNKLDVNGNTFQGGAQFVIFAVEGLVYAIPFPLVQPTSISNWAAYQLPNLHFASNAKRVYFCVTQKSLTTVGSNLQLNATYNVLVMQDGASPAAYWDGDRNLHVSENAPDYSTPSGTWMSWSGGRLWIARGNTLVASDLLDPLLFKERISGATQGDFILPDIITGMVNTVGYTFQTNLIVFTQDQTFSFLSYVTNREAWSATPNFQTILYPALGCVAGLSIVNHAGLLWWYAKGGLVSFNSATTAYLTSRVKYMDNEMVAWTSEMYEDKSGICACSFASYLSISIPANDVFNAKTMVMDYSVADELNSVAPSAWQGVWTGIRPVNWVTALIESTGQIECYALSVDYESLNESHNHLWLAFRDERTDSFSYIDPSNAILTAHNPIYWSMETKLLGDGLDLKVFKYLYVNLMEVDGVLQFKASYRGTRGNYKELINKEIIAITQAWQTDDPEILALLKSGTILVPQTRRLISQVAQPLNLEEDQSVENGYDETIDRCFSLYFQGCGRCAVESAMIVMEPQPEKPTGQNNEDESTLNTVNQDGNSQSYNEGLTSTTTTIAPASHGFNFSNSLFNRPFTPRYRDVYYSSIPPITTIGLGPNCITCLPCSRDSFPPVTFDPTTNDEGPGYGPAQYVGNQPQAFTATCPAGTSGPPVTATVQADTYFALTQQASNLIAYNAAYVQAIAGLVCSMVPVVQTDSETGTNGQAFAYQITSTGSPTSYGLTTSLPAGLALNSTTGVISGTITASSAVQYIIGISATNASGTGYGQLILSVIPMVTSESKTVAEGAAFSYQIVGTNIPTSYGGTPPGWLTIDSVTGIASGTVPMTPGMVTVPLTATNAAGVGTGTLTLNIVVPYQFTVASSGTPHFTKQIALDGGSYATVTDGQTYSFLSSLKIKTTTSGTFSPSGGSEAWSIGKSSGSAALPLLAAGSQASATLTGSGVRGMNGYQNVGGGGEYYPIDTDLMPLPYSGTVSLVGVNLNTTTTSPPPHFLHFAAGGGTFSAFTVETILNF